MAGEPRHNNQTMSKASYGKELIAAAQAADFDKVSALQGADAKYIDDPPGMWGSCDTKSALHMALSQPAVSHADAKKVIVALVAAGADVNALRKDYDWRGCGHSNTAFEMLLGTLRAYGRAQIHVGLHERRYACMQAPSRRSAKTRTSSRPS